MSACLATIKKWKDGADNFWVAMSLYLNQDYGEASNGSNGRFPNGSVMSLLMAKVSMSTSDGIQ